MAKAPPTPSPAAFRPLSPDLSTARRQITGAPGEQALARILAHPLPASLVQSFPEADLHLLIHEIGVDDAGPLLALASNAQLDYVLDAELWQRDRLDNASLLDWTARLVETDPVRMVPYLARRQRDLVEYLLWRNLEVVVREHDQDPSDLAEDYYTLDNVFYLRPRGDAEEMSEAHRGRFLRNFVDRLADHEYAHFRDLLVASTALLPAEREEDALRRRTVRLAEKGFLPFEEAVGVYQPLDAAALHARGPKYFVWQDEEGRSLPVPRFAAGALPDQGAFARALAVCGERGDLGRIEAEFAGLCNRLSVADKRVIRGREEIATLARKAAGYLGIALEVLAAAPDGIDAVRGADLLERYALADLFRVGYGEALRLKWTAERWQHRSWYRRRGLKLTFWDEAGMGVLGGLLLKRPHFFDNYRSGVLYREFATLADIRQTARDLDAILALDDLLARMDLDRLSSSVLAGGTWKDLLLTLWARDRLGLDGEPFPIALDRLRPFYASLWTRQGRVRVAERQRFLRWLARRSRQSPERVSDALAAVLENLFRELEDALGRVGPESLDRRFVHLFRVR